MGSDLERIVGLQPDGSKPPLYCVHAVSGSAYSYAGLSRLLGPDQPVYGFEAPGFDNDRPPVSSLHALATEYTAILREFQSSSGYQLLGWSLGGVVIFEMAKLLTEAGINVTKLILVDAGVPEVLDLPPEREILRRYIKDIMGRSDESPPVLEAVFDGQPEDVEPAALFDAVEAARILPEELDADVLATQYDVFRTLLAAFYSTEVKGSFSGPAVHIMAEQSPDENMDWRPHLPDLREYTIPGTHHSIWSGESLDQMSKIIQSTLDS
jgi:thioesterase domain-containing protein